MRIQVVFKTTPILVPCGDGKLTVGELIEKAIVRFKKLGNRHHDDVIQVRSLRVESGGFVDQDDEVVDVLEDKETVLLDYDFIPHYAHDQSGTTSGISDDTQPFSPTGIDDGAAFASGGHTAFASGTNLSDPLVHPRSEGYETGESMEPNEIHEASQEHEHELHDNPSDLHMTLAASQDELLAGEEWHSGGSQERSPHANRKKWQSYGHTDDSGYVPTKSQESYSHSQPKSQEAYMTDLSLQHSSLEGPTEFSLQPGNREGGYRPPEGVGVSGGLGKPSERSLKKEEELTGSYKSGFLTKGTNRPQDAFHSPTISSVKGHPDGKFGGRGGGLGREPHDGFPVRSRPGEYLGYPHPRYPDGGYYRGGRDGGYPGSEAEFRYHHGNMLEDGYDRGGGMRPGAQEYRRSYGGGDYYHHEMPPYDRYSGYMEGLRPPHLRGRFDRPGDALRGRHMQYRRMTSEEPRMSRTRSHERMDQLQHHGSPFMSGSRHNFDPDFRMEQGPVVDSFLSQPNPSYFATAGGAGVPGMMGPSLPMGRYQAVAHDGRQAMTGPLGYSLSQPGHMMSHDRMFGDFDRSKWTPYGTGGDRVRMRPLNDEGSGLNSMRGRTYSIEEEIARFDDDDMEEQGKDGRGLMRPNPFQRDFRKSMFRDGSVYSNWMERVYEYGIQESEDGNEVPEFEGDASQSQRTPSPTPSGQGEERKENGEDDSDDDEFDNIHIVQLHKGEEPLRISFTHYTSPEGIDLGVFIGGMDVNGFAAKSNKLQVSDRVLACNGVDFTKESNERVEEILHHMAQEPLLRMAISRGVKLNMADLPQGQEGNGTGGREDPDAGDNGRKEQRDGQRQGEGESPARAEQQATASPGSSKIVSPSSQASSTTLTNTRLIGVKHTITLTKGPKGFGFGLTSRDISTDAQSQPIYVKSITTDGPAFVHGQLKIGDRLLEVNGVEVVGMTRLEVVALLREAVGSVSIVVSRQDTVDSQEEEEFPLSANSPSEPQVVGKTVMTFEISVYNSGAAGLGVSVYGRSNLSTVTSHTAGDMGIYIKSIMPGGAAALDGRLAKNDQLLCINGQSLLGKSNQASLDIVRKAMAGATGEDAKVQLVIARRAGAKSASGFSAQMAALGEEPEEEERAEDGEGMSGKEVGIDVPTEVQHTSICFSPPAAEREAIATPTAEEAQPPTPRSIMRTRAQSESRPRSSSASSSTSPKSKRRSHVTLTPSSSDHPPLTSSSSHPITNPSALLKSLRAEGNMGSGEFYDRLEPMIDNRDRERHQLAASSTRSGLAPSMTDWLDGGHLGQEEYSSLDRRGMARSTSQTSDLSAPPSLPSHPFPVAPTHAYQPHPQYHVHSLPLPARDPNRHRSPSSINPSHSPSISSYSLPRDVRQTRQDNLSFDPRYPSHSPYSSDTASTASYPISDRGVDTSSQVPTRGSGRRTKPERGSDRYQQSSSASPAVSLESDHTSDSYSATLPRSNSRSSGRGMMVRSTTPTNAETSSLCSLENYKFADSESSFLRRDDIWRISITKKTKRKPLEDFAHFGFANMEPMVEGEAPLIRTGSDGCLANIEDRQVNETLLRGVEVGPGLGMVKSSSLESLHNVMHHQIIRDNGSDLRSRETRNSFRRAVDRTFDDSRGEQRGVDVHVPFVMNGRPTVPAAMISLRKSPNTHAIKAQPRKKGFLKRVFKKRKSTKKDSDKSISRGTSSDADYESDPGIINGEFNVPRYSLPIETDEDDRGRVARTRPILTHRHTMPVIDDTEPDSNDDESVLATMARV